MSGSPYDPLAGLCLHSALAVPNGGQSHTQGELQAVPSVSPPWVHTNSAEKIKEKAF